MELNWKEDNNLIRKIAKILLGDILTSGEPVSSLVLIDDSSRAELQRWADMSDEEIEAARLSGDTIHINVDDVLKRLEEKYDLDPQLFEDVFSDFDADELEFWEEINQWEEADHGEPTEYYFSCSAPYLKPQPLPPDHVRHNCYWGEDGHLCVKNLSAFWLPEFTLQKEIGGTLYTVTGSYDGTETLDKKMERIMGEKFTEKMEEQK